MRQLLIVAVLLAVFAGSAIALDGDPEKGRILADGCTCHVNRNKLDGMPAQEIYDKMMGYKNNPQNHRIMGRIAQKYGKQEIADLAAYYAGK
jgi:cytochrome c553